MSVTLEPRTIEVVRRILHECSYQPLLREAGRTLREWAGSGEVVVLSATRIAADEFVRANAGSGLLGVHRFTLEQFASNVAANAISERGLCLVTRLGSEAIAARAVFDLNRRDQLQYFKPVAQMPGFARALSGTLLELRSQGVTPAQLKRAGVPGADLARFGSYYATELANRHLADLPMLFDFAEQSSHRLLGLPLICLDLDLEGDAAEHFLASVVRQSPRALAVALTGDDAGLRRLEIMFGVPRVEVAEQSEEPTALHTARKWLFSPETPGTAPRDESVEFFAAAGEGLESVEIARRILELAKQGTAFDHVVIALRDVDRYQALIQEALRRADIPCYYSRGATRPDVAGRAFLALLSCATEGCSATRFAEYLSLGQVRTSSERELPLPWGWEKLLVDAAVIGGPDRWRRRLSGLEQEFRVRLEAADHDEAGRASLEKQIANLRNLEEYALPLIDQLGALPKSATWGTWLDRLTSIAEYALRNRASVLAVFEELEAMDAVGPVELDEVYAVLEERLRFLRVEPEGRRYGAVFVCSIEEIHGLDFPVLFLPGLAEGIFPRRALEDPLLLDRARVALDAGLTLRDDQVARERLRLLSAVAAASRKLVVSYPSMDTMLSRPRVPSFYALEVVRAVEGRLPDLASFQKRAAAAACTRLSWPAPEDTAAAIDDAEYDLASLKPTIEGKSNEKSSARYLLEVNVHLARSLRARGRRWRPRWFDADGLVAEDDETRRTLQDFSLTRKPYSPSALQNFAQCPYRFALRSIFHLAPREVPEALEQMDPLTRGAMFHRAQFRMFGELQTRGWLPLTMDRLEQVFALADQVIDAVARESEELLAPAIPRVWQTEIEDVRSDFRAWLREVAQSEIEWSPIRFEFGFGLPSDQQERHDSSSSPQPASILDGYLVRGSMDLVEQNQRSGALRVVDHKTGKAPEEQPLAVGRGSVLQPLLYALAGETLWEKPVQSARLFYCTQRGGYRRIDFAVTAQSRDRLRQVLQTIESAIAMGFLPAAPADKACSLCDYRVICGPYEEERVRRMKNQRDLEALETVRGLP